MSVTQTVEIPKSRRLTIDVPSEVPEGRTILTFTPASDDSSKSVKHSAYGRLKAYANPSLIPEESGAWAKAAAEKHALR